jgi:flagellar motor switch protein FliG
MPPAAKAAVASKGPINLSNLNGSVKAAIWLLSTDEKSAIDAMALLSSDEVVRLREAVDGMEKVGPEVLASIHSEFGKLMNERPLRVRGSMQYLHQIANQALGEARAAQLLLPRDALPPSAVLMEADVEILAGLLGEEYPQVIAAVLATLKPQKACQVLLKFPDSLRREVVGRVARLHKVPHASLARAQQVLSNGLPMAAGEDYDIDGVRIAATLLNQLETEQAEEILINLGTETLTTQVRQAMFTFEDLGRLDRRGLQTLLKEVSSDTLLMSLKAASDGVKTKIFEGLSKRAGEMMREDLQMMGPTKLADVEKAQTDIVTVALRLRTEGKLTVVGMGGDFV